MVFLWLLARLTRPRNFFIVTLRFPLACRFFCFFVFQSSLDIFCGCFHYSTDQSRISSSATRSPGGDRTRLDGGGPLAISSRESSEGPSVGLVDRRGRVDRRALTSCRYTGKRSCTENSGSPFERSRRLSPLEKLQWFLIKLSRTTVTFFGFLINFTRSYSDFDEESLQRFQRGQSGDNDQIRYYNLQ